MNRDLHKMLRESKLDKEDYNEVSKILTRLLDEKYNKNVILERLVHQANFDKDIFMHYMFKVRKESGISCYETKDGKADALGFDRTTSFGYQSVTFIDFFFENYDKINNK